MKSKLYEAKYQPDIRSMRWSIWSALRLAFGVSPAFTTMQIIINVINGLFPAVTVMIQAVFVDTVLAIFAGEKEISQLILPLIGLFLWLLWQQFSGIFVKHGQGIRKRKMGVVLQNAFLKKISLIGYHRLEMPETQDLLRKVTLEPEEVEEETLNNITEIGILCLQNLSVFAIVVVHVWWAGFLLAAGAIPLSWLSLKAGNKNYQSQSDVTEKKRRYEYISQVMLGRDAVLERTLFSYVPFLNERYRSTFQEAYEVEKRTLFRGMVNMKAGGVMSTLPALFAAFILIPGVRSGGLSVGMYISIVNAVFSLVGTMTWSLSFQMERLAQNRAKAKDIGMFCGMPEEDAGRRTAECSISGGFGEDTGFESVEFKDVRFCYPGSNIDILDGISFRLEKGKHYAFVGRNGAGKSTIIKLMTGLYPEYEGKILINGRDLKDWKLKEGSRWFACVWQDYARYYMTLRENLQFSGGHNDQVLSGVLESVGLAETAGQFPDDLDTVLGKLEEGGIDISGGQWQRIAIARAIVNGTGQGKAFILDEPAASLDPIAENRIYKQFADLSRGETALFITHRLGAVKDVDEIFVLEKGKVAERGSHKELMERGEIYAEMYTSQRGWYL